VLRTLKKHLLNDHVWPDFTSIPHPDNAVLKLKHIRPGKPFEVNGYTVTAHKVNHSVPAAGYILESGNGKRLLYTGDTGPTDEIWRAAKKQIDCAIVEVSMPNRMKQMAMKTGHLTASLLKNEIKKMRNIPRRILITHPKPQYFAQIKTEIEKLGMNNIKLLRDGKEYKI
jgi:ribonuclease BN (tRNA processing enzyme)